MQLTYDEIMDVLDIKYTSATPIGYTVPHGIYEISDFNFMLKFLLPNEVKGDITNDENRLRSNLTTNKTIGLTEKYCFLYNFGFTQSHSRVSGENEGCNKKIPSTYKSEKPNERTGIDKIHFKCECIIGSFVNCIREPIL